MLTKAKHLKGFTLECLDGEIGKAKEFLFNDQTWAIRYLVADTGDWLIGRQVLISPNSLLAIDPEKQRIDVKLTKKQIEECPPLSSDKPVSRHWEETFFANLGVPIDWDIQMKGADPWDAHLRSTRDVSGHHIHAEDGDIGHVDIKLSREIVKMSPEYTEGSLVARDYETELHQYYKRQGYWTDSQ